MKDFLNRIIQGDCVEILKTLPDNSIDCCVTSPPYFGLRDYGHTGQIGLEQTPEFYVSKMVEVFTEVKRVLKKEGTLWLNLGDSYGGSGRGPSVYLSKEHHNISEIQMPFKSESIKPKDLIGVPWMVAFALRSSGWYLRQDIIWHKPNPMPESVTDRCTKAHEYIFLMSKSAKYYYDQEAIKQPFKDESLFRLSQDVKSQKESDRVPSKSNGNMKAVGKVYTPSMAGGGSNINGHKGSFNKDGELIGNGFANKRSVWTVTTMPYKEAHFATFPETLIVDCIKAGCPVNGIVLDPFIGAGTTALVAQKILRNFIGIELNEKYIKIAEKRLRKQFGLFNTLQL